MKRYTKLVLLSFFELLLACGEEATMQEEAELLEPTQKEFAEIELQESLATASASTSGCLAGISASWLDGANASGKWYDIQTTTRNCIGFWCWDVQTPQKCDVCTITASTGLTGRNHNPDAGFLVKGATMRKCTEGGIEYRACVISDTAIAGQILDSARNGENRDCNFLSAQSSGLAKHSHPTSGERYWWNGYLTIDTKGSLEQ